jgi:prepilin-type N-terminal cleavage/methylation domain-containing protein
MTSQTNRSNAGFTIVELMISTAILSTILLLTTAVMLNIGKLYYKGVNQARVQDGSRAILDEVSQHLQFSDQALQAGHSNIGGVDTSVYCIGNTRYSYVKNIQIGQIKHVLWRDTPSAGCVATSPANLTLATPSTGGTELIPPNSRLTEFSITIASPYTVAIGVAYGDDDLLNLTGINTTCKGGHEDQYCATAHLTTTVVKRLTGGH